MMAKRSEFVVLEEWLWHPGERDTETFFFGNPSYLRAWADLRDSLQNQEFHTNHLQSLRTLVDVQFSFYIVDPQVKIPLFVLFSQKVFPSQGSYPLFVRLLYISVRKSLRHSPGVIDSVVEVLLHLFSRHIYLNKNLSFFSEGVLLLGALSFVLSASEKSKIVCLKLLYQLFEEDCKLIHLLERTTANVLAGIGYALSSTVNIYFVRVISCLESIFLWINKSNHPKKRKGINYKNLGIKLLSHRVNVDKFSIYAHHKYYAKILKRTCFDLFKCFIQGIFNFGLQPL